MVTPTAHESFRALHQRPGGFIMPNPWDGASAVLLKRAGFEALGSSSIAIAFALGKQDGRRAVSLADAVENAALLGRVTGLPVNGDLEDGFGPDPEDCAWTVQAAIAAGLGGVGIEDTTADPANPIHDFDHAAARVRAAAQAAHGQIVLTGRTDNFFHGRTDLADTIRRLTAFAEVGADVLYAPGLPDMDAIRAVVRAVAPKWVNVGLGPRSGPVTFADLSAAGVARVSTGGALYFKAMSAMVEAAAGLLAGNLAAAVPTVKSGEIAALLPQP